MYKTTAIIDKQLLLNFKVLSQLTNKAFNLKTKAYIYYTPYKKSVLSFFNIKQLF